jgi:hypothetical protein
LVNQVSKQIVELKLRHQLALIFEQLDSDKDGVISGQHINLAFLSADLLNVFRPLFKELDTFNESLDKEEFIDSSLRLYKTLNVTQRNLILKFA